MGDMKRTIMLSVKLTAEERERLERAATAAGLRVGAYVRKCIDLGGVVGEHRDLIAHIHKELKRALLETLKKELPVGRKKIA